MHESTYLNHAAAPRRSVRHRTARAVAAALFLTPLAGAGAVAGSGGPATAATRPLTRTFDLVAQPARIALRPGVRVNAWTFNGTVPGPELRVTQGQRVRATLLNRLPQPTTIHWHGLAGPNAVDGVPGVTQRPVPPGGRFVYTFTAGTPGTYWYHSHVDSAAQVDRGLYGALVVVPAATGATRSIDRSLLLDEWPVGSMRGMTMRASTPQVARPYVADSGMGAYRTFTVNGKAFPATRRIAAATGALVRLRLINAGYLTHVMDLGGTPYRLVATDGHAVNAPQATTAALPIGAGQRMDIRFRVPRGGVTLRDVSGLPGAGEMRVAVGPRRMPAMPMGRPNPMRRLMLLNLARYGEPATAPFRRSSRFDRVFRLTLRTARMPGMPDMPGKRSGKPAMPGMSGKQGGMPGMRTYTINEKTFDRAAPLRVKRGQRVKITFVNRTDVVHPMHLHGHQPQVLTLNGVPVTGAPLVQDTVMVLPGRSTTVAFTANNPGVWMLHCHELHHAAGGMATLLQYAGSRPVTPGGGGE